MSLEDEIKNLRQLIKLHQRHLQKDKEQQAVYGIATPSYLLVEIENREAAIGELQQKLEELDDHLKQGLEEPKITIRQKLPTKSTHLAEDARISLKEMLINLIFDYLMETEDIEVRFNSTQKSYSIVLSKEVDEQRKDTTRNQLNEVKNE